ncbi:L-rhamnose isomerase/sugar isomerase [Algoriphagus ratkowskyi]|uniref:Sugar isomerase n=1 Tax=Algoriphagus ratkowskyi TaxID=57028 RepID=A0A2W7R9T2_9BACT|nr:TIM barrel protein [Algoriphagus ratkowskyi]PZX57673.1 L-rhamnose isomerase/sugar isomerase [Algoriphagus ratkowskyi]TXD78944.1 sugar isomerase [Algoriphagus ratkowskyi]
MRITKDQLASFSPNNFHFRSLELLRERFSNQHIDFEKVIRKIQEFQIAIPSAALGNGRASKKKSRTGGEPRDLSEKLEDIGLLQQLTCKTNSVSIYIPYDIPEDFGQVKDLANELNLEFDTMNSTSSQDQNQKEYAKLGSLGNPKKAIRDEAIAHNEEVINIGKKLGSKGLTVWMADGSNYPGQSKFRSTLGWTEESLREIYEYMPSDWDLMLEYKPYEPNCYHTVVPDWGTSSMLAKRLGERAKVLVDLGHHLPKTNIEQIVATLMYQNLLAGFHFNDSKYGDDELNAGSIKPYQLFLIFCELISGDEDGAQTWDSISWMIDASYNTQDPLVDLIQALESISIAYTKALLVDRKKLQEFQQNGEGSQAQEILQMAYLTDVRPLVCEARVRAGGAAEPLEAYRILMIRNKLVHERGRKSHNSIF